MDRNVKGQRALESLEAVFSEYEEQIEKLNGEVSALREGLEKTREIVVLVAQEFGMSRNDSQFCNALGFVKKNLSQFQAAQKRAKELGYSSLNNLFKAVAMTTTETKNRKTRAYFEEVLPKELVDLPIGLQLTETLLESKTIEKLLIETVYPTLEKYLQSPNVNLEEFLDLWSQVSDIEDLNDIKNWCVERLYNIPEQNPEDLMSLEELTYKSVAFSAAYNSRIRQGLLDWVRNERVVITRKELEEDWEFLSSNSVINKLLKKYAGCPMHSSVKEAAKELGYLNASGDWSEDLSLEGMSAAMRAADAITEIAKWNTDFVDVATEAMRNSNLGKVQHESFIEFSSTP